MQASLLLIDPEPICREPLAKLLQLAGYRVTCVSHALEATRALQACKPNLIVLELALPGLSGWAFVRALRQSATMRDVPVIVLTSMADPNLIRAVASLGVKDILLKSNFSLDNLLARIKRAISNVTNTPSTATSASSPPVISVQTTVASPPANVPPSGRAGAAGRAIPKLLTREQVLERIERCGESKTLSGVVSQIISVASSPRGEVSELVALLKQDIVLSTRVLQAANSAAYVSEKPRVNTVEEAVRNIGLSTVRNIALSVGVYEALPSDAADGFNLVRCWQHSVAVAGILDRLAATIDGVAPGMAHLVGLCHDLGEVILRQCLAEQYDVLADFQDDDDDADGGAQQLEVAAFGMSFPELTERILSKLDLPSSIATPIRECAERRRSLRAKPGSKLGQALVLADGYAHGLHLASCPSATVAPITVAEYRAATGETAAGGSAPLMIDGKSFRTEVICNTSLLARLSSADERKLSKPLFPRARTRVWYARHAALSTFDPLEAALSSLANVKTNPRLPTAAETPYFDALVVAVPKHGLSSMLLEEAEQVCALGAGKPLLYLAGSPAEGVRASSAKLRQYPIQLRSLARFVNATTQSAIPAAAAAG